MAYCIETGTRKWFGLTLNWRVDLDHYGEAEDVQAMTDSGESVEVYEAPDDQDVYDTLDKALTAMAVEQARSNGVRFRDETAEHRADYYASVL